MLASELRLRGREVVSTREPGGTPLGARVRQLVLDTEEQVDPLAELLLYAADRAQHVRTLVRPALESDDVVSEVVALATGGLMPDLTLIFDLPVDESQRRAHRRTSKDHQHDRLDAEDAAFHTRVHDAYQRIAHAEPERARIIDAAGSVQETQAQVMRIVMPFLENRQSAAEL